jgi:sulfur carrier protein ThiS
MKKFVTTFLIAMTMAVALFVSACGGSGAANNANNSKPTPLPTSTTTAAANTVDQSKLSDALKKAGFADVTVATDPAGQAIVRGTVAKGKTQDMMKVALEANGKPVKNETTEK